MHFLHVISFWTHWLGPLWYVQLLRSGYEDMGRAQLLYWFFQ